jgi:hypothetical protein
MRRILLAAVVFGAAAIAAGAGAQGFEVCRTGRCAVLSTAAASAVVSSTPAHGVARDRLGGDDQLAPALEVWNTAQAKRALAFAILLGAGGNRD